MSTITAKSKGAVAWTAECPITYVDFDKPREPRFEGQKPQYGCLVLVDKQDKETLTALGAAIKEAQGKLTDTDPAQPFDTLLKDGDEKTDRDGKPLESFKGKWYFAAKASAKPVLYILTDKAAVPAGDGEIVNWDMGQAVVYFSAYDFNGRKGVSARLLGFCKTGSTRQPRPVAAEGMFSHLAPTEVPTEDPFAAPIPQVADQPF